MKFVKAFLLVQAILPIGFCIALYLFYQDANDVIPINTTGQPSIAENLGFEPMYARLTTIFSALWVFSFFPMLISLIYYFGYNAASKFTWQAVVSAFSNVCGFCMLFSKEVSWWMSLKP